MRERNVDFRGRVVRGMRVQHAVSRPHQLRLHLRPTDGPGLVLRFRPEPVPEGLAGATIDSIKETSGWIRLYVGGRRITFSIDGWGWAACRRNVLWAFELPEAAREPVAAALGALEPAAWGLPPARVFVAPPGPFDDWEVWADPEGDGALAVSADVWELWEGALRVSPYRAALRVPAGAAAATVVEVDVR